MTNHIAVLNKRPITQVLNVPLAHVSWKKPYCFKHDYLTEEITENNSTQQDGVSCCR